jgi:type IV pilus assembly protein PilM
VIIAQNDDALFVKYIDVGGRQMDEAVSRALNMDISEANALRRRNDEGIDPEITLCVRYHSVTFRGKPLERLLVGGGEASTMIVNLLSERLGMPAHASDPFRRLENRTERGRGGQWDVAAGLALRDLAPGVSS